jgi:hypothetical protein
MARKTRLVKKQSRRSGEERKNPTTNKDSLNKLREWFLPNEEIFSQIKRHGNIKWAPVWLVWLALCWAWVETANLTNAFTEALDCCHKMFGTSPLKTYPGFIGALATWTAKLMPVLRVILRQRMQQIGGPFWRIGGWVPIAFDGSRSSAPRSRANEAALCAPNYGKGYTATYRKKKSKGMRRKRNETNKAHPQEPQAWITMMWHMGTRLPWDWLLGPSNSSERAHVMEMLQAQEFPKKTLFCGDAGFVGYPLWERILQKKGDFLVRVGGNVSLLLQQVNYRVEKENKNKNKDLQVLCWPQMAIQANQPPLRLRLVRVELGKSHAWMLTSVRDRRELNAKDIVRFYKLRWGVEVEFRGLKQTLDGGKLRSRNDKNVIAELNWSILAMAVAELFWLKEQRAQRTSKAEARDPKKRSLAKTIRALRSCLSKLNETPQPGEELVNKLQAAVTDDYVRKKPKRARYRPKNPDKKALGSGF